MVAKLFFGEHWQRAFLLMMLTMIIDIDHLLADPIYDPTRCSIGFHPLHTPPAMVVYAILCGFRKTRALGVGLVIHMLLDSMDCFVNTGAWYTLS
ncbi:DUF6122 family protein [Pleionea sp. CnH1-48]|nr:DUF6122 family protein [Pleionea sp. CnH1-48]